MKKLIATVSALAALALPAAPAAASDAAVAGTRSCGPGYYGFVVWVINPKTGEPKDVFEYCEPIGPPPAPTS